MASNHSTDREDRKASSLTDMSHTAPGAVLPETGRAARATRPIRRDYSRLRVLLWDLLLLLLLVGLVTGGYFGYRALRRQYAPVWETRDVVFCVEMENIALDMVKYNQDGRPSLTGRDLWSSDRTDADCLGRVTDVQTVLITHADGSTSLTLYLTVEASADYLKGHGYRMGATMLLAGTESIYRLPGLSAEGTIISLCEKNDLAAEADTGLVLPEGQTPGAGE